LLQQNYAAVGKKQTCSSEPESPVRKRNAARAYTDTGDAMRAIFGACKYRRLKPCKVTHKLGINQASISDDDAAP
jgi:hypothetical protein